MSTNVSAKSKLAIIIMKLVRPKLLLCMGILVLGSLFSMFNATTVGLAWDAGDPHDQCISDPCTGGVKTPSLGVIGLVQGWFGNSRVADCPPSYTNNGLTCGRGADSMSAPSRLADCPSGYTNMGTYCGKGILPWEISTRSLGSGTCPAGYFKGPLDRCYKDCPPGYTNMGESCFRGVSTLGMNSMTCNANEKLDSGRCVPVPPNIKMRGNTHFYITRQALYLLQKSGDPVAQNAFKRMGQDSACLTQWTQGLYDGDKKFSDSPTDSSTGGTHFYNPTRKDAFGQNTRSTTYLFLEVDAGDRVGADNTNARRAASIQIAKVPLSGPTGASGCYELGLALHYMTDMTQPMHTSSFSGLSSPKWLHPYFEAYVPAVQGRFDQTPAKTWDERWKGETPDNTLYQAAVRSNGFAPALLRALDRGGDKCTIDGLDVPLPYNGFCFVNDPVVDAQIGMLLPDAYQSTASYIYNVFKTYSGGSAQNFSSNLVGTGWTYNYGGNIYQFDFGQTTIDKFSNGWWQGITWAAIGNNQLRFRNTQTGKEMTITFDSPNSFTGIDWDGSPISGKRRTN